MLGEECAWYQKIGNTVAKASSKVTMPIKEMQSSIGRPVENEETPREWDVPADVRQRRVYEFAEMMEEGLAPGLTSSHVELPEPSKELRLLVQRAPDRKSYQLTTTDKKPLLLARALPGEDSEFEIFVASSSQTEQALGPAFTLTCPAKRQWILKSIRCERCEHLGTRKCGVRELAKLSQYVEPVGDGQAFCMDVVTPMVNEDRQPDVWCAVCGDVDGDDEERTCGLTTRRPRWNPKHKSLTLDFRGRCSMASAKNFQLESPDKPGKTKLLFGKVAAQSFVLDYSSPLGAVQAFAAALTTSHWK